MIAVMLCSRYHALTSNYASLTNMEEYMLKAMVLKLLKGNMSLANALAII